MSRAEIVERDARAALAQHPELADALLDILHEEALRDLEVDPAVTLAQRGPDVVDEGLLAQLQRRDVDRDARRAQVARFPVAERGGGHLERLAAGLQDHAGLL